MSEVERFANRLVEQWLPSYCHDPKRAYLPEGFRASSIEVSEADARDCMLAIDQAVVIDTGGGRYRAPRNSAHEVLFWEGARSADPRTITLWLEPVITFAALGRLHAKYGWPSRNLGTQAPGWAFDVVAYQDASASPHILGEVKKTVRELDRLKEDLMRLSRGGPVDQVLQNSVKKWAALLDMKPQVLWLLGPAEVEYVYRVTHFAAGAELAVTDASALDYGSDSGLRSAVFAGRS